MQYALHFVKRLEFFMLLKRSSRFCMKKLALLNTKPVSDGFADHPHLPIIRTCALLSVGVEGNGA